MSAPVIETYDEILHSEALEQRFAAAIEIWAGRRDRDEERSWLEAGRRRIAAARAGSSDVLDRALRLPELHAQRGDLVKQLQVAAVDSVDALLSAITALNERSPLIEAIYGKLKTMNMRRAKPDDFEAFLAGFEKRLAGGYVARMLADDSYAPIAPDVAKLRAAFAAWRDALRPAPLEAEEERALRDDLAATRDRIAPAVKQALLLAEASFAADAPAREASRIFDRPRRRPARAA
jgi:hypothetical protein